MDTCVINNAKQTRDVIAKARDGLQENRARYLTERGQNVNGQPNVIYLSTDNAATWLPLHEFVDKDNNLAYCEEEVMFFEHQLDLFGKLSYVSVWASRRTGVGVVGRLVE